MSATEPQQPEWIAEAPIQIRQVQAFQASPASIWNILSDNQTWPDWFPGFTKCEFSTEPPHGVTSVRELTQGRFTVSEEITRWEPNRTWAMTVLDIKPGIVQSMAEIVHLHEDERNGTRIEWHIGVRLHWWATPASSQLSKTLHKNVRSALLRLDNQT